MRKMNKFGNGNCISKCIMERSTHYTQKRNTFFSSEKHVLLQLNNSLIKEGETMMIEILNQESLNRNKII